jgi:hypothetical protein
MTIETLIKAVPPPAAPTYAFHGPWEPIEAELRTPLPQDYKDLIRLYGFGTFMGHLSVNGPTVPYDHCRLVPEAFAVQQMFVNDSPHIRMYPQPGGLLACGNVQDVGYLFWLTRGPVDEWPIVIWDHDASEEDELKLFEFDLTDFLAGLITGDIPIDNSPENIEWFREQPPFAPHPGPGEESPLASG